MFRNATNSCRRQMKILQWVPVIAGVILVILAYYAYVVVTCLFTSDILEEKVAFILAYHLLQTLALWSYYKAIATPCMKPPAEFHLEEATWSELAYNYHWLKQSQDLQLLRLRLGILTTAALNGHGLPAYCAICKLLKPDRCHHCSRCQVCVLKMDHHCPWINNCVGFHNYKFFLLFLLYTLVMCLFIFLTSIRFVCLFAVRIYNGENVASDYANIQIVIMEIVAVILGLAILSLLKLHCDLIRNNLTTLEHSRPVGLVGDRPNYHTFNQGLKDNLLQIFGCRMLLWLLPVFTSTGDGAHFQIRSNSIDNYKVGQQTQENGQGELEGEDEFLDEKKGESLLK